MIEAGKTALEIATEFDISLTHLMEHVVMLQELDQKVYVIEGLFEGSETAKSHFRKAGIVFHREVFEKIGFKPGDAFEMKASASRIILDKIPLE